MREDAIMRELRAVRAAYAKRFGYDLKKMVADLQRQDDAVKPARPTRTKAKRTSARPKPHSRATKPAKRRRAA